MVIGLMGKASGSAAAKQRREKGGGTHRGKIVFSHGS